MDQTVRNCKRCDRDYPYTKEYWNTSKGYMNSCKECKRANNRAYMNKNKDKYAEQHRQWQEKNKESEKIKRRERILANPEYYKSEEQRQKQRERSKKWRNQNKEKVAAYKREWKQKQRKLKTNYAIASSLRSRLRQHLKGTNISGSHVRSLGCSIQELREHLESKFVPGMTWKNWSRDGWHIDHIIPLCKFDLKAPDQLNKACHYTNLQPLWAIDNLKKNRSLYIG